MPESVWALAVLKVVSGEPSALRRWIWLGLNSARWTIFPSGMTVKVSVSTVVENEVSRVPLALMRTRVSMRSPSGHLAVSISAMIFPSGVRSMAVAAGWSVDRAESPVRFMSQLGTRLPS